MQPDYSFTVTATTRADQTDEQSSSQTVSWTVTSATANDHFGDADGNSWTGTTDVSETYFAGLGADVIDGGTDLGSTSDTVSYRWSHEGVTADLSDDSNNAGGTAVGDTYTNIENLIGSAFADRLTGDGNDNSLNGGAGDDTLIGGAGDDTLIGGAGSDTADYSGAAAETARTINADNSNGLAATVSGVTGVYVNLNIAGAQATGNSDASGDTLSGIENLIGSAHNDVLVGDGNANTLIGGAGDDTLIGGAGSDTADYSGAAAETARAINADNSNGLAATVSGVTGVYVNLNIAGHRRPETRMPRVTLCQVSKI